MKGISVSTSTHDKPQRSLPTLLQSSASAPPGLEMFGPGASPSLESCRSPKSQGVSHSSEAYLVPSECSTVDTAEAKGISSAEETYRPGRLLQQSATISSPPEAVDERHCLSLEEVLPDDATGTPECPSIGSAGHGLGLCKPCDFMYRNGCRAGFKCQFCHLCPPGETRRRKKQKQATARMHSRMIAAYMWQTQRPCAVALQLQELVR
eukprot:TRINITY_DN3363_c0_g1_i1.p1 TRINITY_DN3363_c0_g1~~TRINITY_DN3363_c0_g1_i1.p1  ORF type:complete len:208 (+),score=35.93 TRINITY_DN3363_c0_g1_i1:105-728(+)